MARRLGAKRRAVAAGLLLLAASATALPVGDWQAQAAPRRPAPVAQPSPRLSAGAGGRARACEDGWDAGIGHERMRGGADDPSSEAREVVEEDGLFLPHGPARRRKILFRTASTAECVSSSASGFFVKAPGSMLNPANWWTMGRGLLTGAPERTMRMMPINKDEDQEGPLIMIDGADDIATALQGSGLPQNLANALQAFVLYPLVLPIVELGFRGAEDDHEENTAEAFEASQVPVPRVCVCVCVCAGRRP